MTATRPDRALALLIGGGLAVAFVLCGAMNVAGWTLGTATSGEHRVIHGPVAALRITGDGGDDVVVEAGTGPGVTVDSVARGSFHAPRPRVAVNGASVSVGGGCGAVWFDHCHASVTVRVPPGTPVEVGSRSGDVSVAGLSGPVRLTTASGDVSARELTGPVEVHASSGDVDVHDLSGTATLEASSGDIEGNGLSSRTVHARTGSGDVDLLFATAPHDVDAETGSGDISLLVPRGRRYAVDAEPSSGERVVGIRTDPRASRVVRARTGSGDINVLYAG
jgi:hypothetical protein